MWLLVADPDLKSGARRCNAQVAITQASDQIERLAGWLLLREPDCVVGDVLLDGLAHLGGRSEVSVGGDEACEPLVRALEVVPIDVQRESSHVVGEVAENGTTQKFLP